MHVWPESAPAIGSERDETNGLRRGTGPKGPSYPRITAEFGASEVSRASIFFLCVCVCVDDKHNQTEASELSSIWDQLFSVMLLSGHAMASLTRRTALVLACFLSLSATAADEGSRSLEG